MKEKPNILFISTDQQTADLLGCKNPELKTPHLDKLAEQGMLFNRAYCPNPTCTPTRASIITGLMPSQHGAYSLGTKLDESVPTLGDILGKGGYAADLIGKAHFQPLRTTGQYDSIEAYPILQHLEFWEDYNGPFYGFDHVELARNHADEAHVGQHYALWMESKGADDWRRYFQPPTGQTPSQRGEWNIPPELHYNTWIAERTEARMEKHVEEGTPFFVWASFFDPHPPYVVPEPYASMYDPADVTVPQITPGEHGKNPPHFQWTQESDPDYSGMLNDPQGTYIHGCHTHLQDRDELAKDIATYYGMMTFLDDSIGRILDRLDELGQRDNTLVVFTSDHGHFTGHHGLIAKGPYHYEELVRIPFIARWPGKIAENEQNEALLSLVDLAPTFLAAANQKIPIHMTGRSQLGVLTGEQETVRDHVIVENRHQPTTLHLNSYINDRYKITVYSHDDYGELFDLQEDPGETNNLWDDPGSQALRGELMHAMAQGQMKQLSIPMPRVSGA